MKSLRIRPLGFVELPEDENFMRLYTPVVDLMFFLAQYAYSPERRTDAIKNALRAVSKIESQLKGMSSDSLQV